MDIRPRRSVLYMPATNTRAMEKARSLPADTLIMDLEDAVSPGAKTLARRQAAVEVRRGGYGKREVVVRVNPLGSPWGPDDVAVVAELPIDAILLPKVETPGQILSLIGELDKRGAAANLSIWFMVETPRGISQIHAIAGCHPRVACIILGTSDLLKEMRARHTTDRISLIAPLSLSILAARAHRLDVIDGVYLDLKDIAGFRKECEQARDLGFDGKSVIHPNQIEAANAVFAPSQREISEAAQIISAWDEAQKEGEGVVVVNGKMVERLHVEEARRIMALSSAIDELTASGSFRESKSDPAQF